MPYGAGAVMYISLISFWWGVNFVRFCGSNNKIQLDYVIVFLHLSALPFVATMSVHYFCRDHDHTRYHADCRRRETECHSKPPNDDLAIE